LLISGAGTAFCAGGDVKGMGSNSSKAETPFEDRVADLRTKQRTLTGALVAVRKPTIAALPGPAAGAGMALALACDIRIAGESAIMSTGYARIGLTGDYGIAWMLTRLVGTSQARELMFLSERIDARRCETLGLVNRVVPDADLIAETRKLAMQIVEASALTVAIGKQAFYAQIDLDQRKAYDYTKEVMSLNAMAADAQEGIGAFLEKRKPNWCGK